MWQHSRCNEPSYVGTNVGKPYMLYLLPVSDLDAERWAERCAEYFAERWAEMYALLSAELFAELNAIHYAAGWIFLWNKGENKRNNAIMNNKKILHFHKFELQNV